MPIIKIVLHPPIFDFITELSSNSFVSAIFVSLATTFLEMITE